MPKKDEVKSASKRGLTPKQEKFCQLYIELGNASEAYRQVYNAGSMKTGAINTKAKELLKNGPITVRISELMEYHKQRHILTVDRIISDLQELRDIAMGRKATVITIPVKNADGEMVGNDVASFVFEPASANKALELLGKHLGMFKDRLDVTTGGNPLPTTINVVFGDEREDD